MYNISMEFKKINPDEYSELLYQMDVEAFNRDFDFSSTSVKLTLSFLKGCEVFLVYEKNIPIGFLAYKTNEGGVKVKQIIVLPKYQKKSYGKLIVKKLLELVKGNNVYLHTHPKNTAAIILYLKNGFQITAWKENYYGDGEPRLIFRCDF